MMRVSIARAGLFSRMLCSTKREKCYITGFNNSSILEEAKSTSTISTIDLYANPVDEKNIEYVLNEGFLPSEVPSSSSCRYAMIFKTKIAPSNEVDGIPNTFVWVDRESLEIDPVLVVEDNNVCHVLQSKTPSNH